MALRVTQCPSCDSTFNTSARMLEAARGLVRCGACLSVFEANENFFQSLSPESNDDLEPGETGSVFISGQDDYFDPTTFFTRSELLEEDNEERQTSEAAPDKGESEDASEDAELLDIEFNDSWTISESDSTIEPNELKSDYHFEDPPGIVSIASIESIEVIGTEIESIDPEGQTLEELPDLAHIVLPQQDETETDQMDTEGLTINESHQDIVNIDTASVIDQFHDQSKSDAADPEESEQEINWLYKDLAFLTGNYDSEARTNDIEEFLEAVETEISSSKVDDIGAEPVDAPNLESKKEGQDQENPENKEEIRARLEASMLKDEEVESLTPENVAAISNVDSSLELGQLKPKEGLKRLALYSTAFAALLIILAGQFLWQRLPILSLDPQIRPWYELACGAIGCELPLLQDLVSIQTDNLVIRSHPDIPDSLELTAIFRNTADFQQPFPIIELSFSDINAQPVASREFLPTEYLPPSLHTISNMPVGAPVQIRLELVDPGESAVNYHLNYKPFPR